MTRNDSYYMPRNYQFHWFTCTETTTSLVHILHWFTEQVEKVTKTINYKFTKTINYSYYMPRKLSRLLTVVGGGAAAA